MSWSGFKKAASRAGTQVMMKTGHVEKTSDREYEVEERRYRTLESASLRLQKEAKGYLDSLRAMTASQMRIAETIDAFYGEAGAKDGVSRSYKQAVEDLDAETVKALDGPYRCVPVDRYGEVFDEDEGVLDQRTIDEIEREMNGFTRKRKDSAVVSGGGGGGGSGIKRVSEEFDGAMKLMDFVYRTTVLEPISRFCAYFPDINECIKKRNHKLLDYDAVRAKVRKLTEKPDKDPSKLPRTEKEAEMVSLTSFLRETSSSTLHNNTTDMDIDLSVPSPPKTMEKIKRQLLQDEEQFLLRHSGLTGIRRSPSLMSKVSSGMRRSSPRLSSQSEDDFLWSSPQPASPYSALPVVRESSTEALLPPLSPGHYTHLPSISERTTSNKLPSSPSMIASIISAGRKKKKTKDAAAGKREQPLTPTPFFHPSELEQIMQPLKEEYLLTQTNLVLQSKAAYDQLNEQLTTELPQLIDLRVPYLDPSFEALVKIQLRFCAEAYSRMAQVQQYLEPETREQYASGELDARVEEVLGRVRELSIAGTV
ncbi:BAR adaptor protein Hob3 [Elasticomyces elasticus]|nr:BAR adaptor protein Hob3 [Elasticomyces elasticus]